MTAIPIVGIGASAGGIDALRHFFERMPADTGMGFVVVLHLAADRKSLLPEILARWTRMPVSEAQDGDEVQANHVHVIPGGVIATLQQTRLSLQAMPGDAVRGMAPIDAFLDSLASNLKEDAVGVVLSGTGHDGTLGLKAIKASGGLTLAQGSNGSKPEYAGMPDSAVAAGGVDLLVPAEEMISHILAARKTRPEPTGDPAENAQRADTIRLEVCAILLSQLGHDFSQYKGQTFMRRVQRRMQVLRLTDLDQYVTRLRTDREQVVLLFRDLLISVTSFFRDAAAFTALEKTVIPRLFADKNAGSEIRLWVAGCSTGEEAYSLAILLREHLDTVSAAPKVQVFASDIDELAIATARAGRYPASLLEGMSAERRSRFFTDGADGFTVRQEVREMCTFSTHSLIRDPPFSRINMVSCRNLLIYLDSDPQDRIIPIFHYALMPGGILMLGSSETIAPHERLFTTLDRTHRIFLRQAGPGVAPSLSRTPEREVRPRPGSNPTAPPDPKGQWALAVSYANRRVLERFASAFVVVDGQGEVMHYSSHTGKFLEPALGVPTTNLFDMARPMWGADLRQALRRCVETGRQVEQERSFRTSNAGPTETVKLVVEPLPVRDPNPLYMIVFVELEQAAATDQPARIGAPAEPEALITQLERANRDLREQLQAVTEEHATAIEELRSSNEELQSVNEEMQSSNEELETSKEEIQSVNEELNTVNLELTAKIDQLDRSNSDLRNLFESTKVATVFLDPFLIVRSFTPEIASIYNLIPSDQGRPLTDIVSRLNYDTLREDVQHVLRTLEPLERRVDRVDGSVHYLMRILPYRSPDNAVDGSLITFVDVTTIVRAEAHQRLLVDELNHRVKNMLTVVISLASNTLRRSTTLEQFSDVFLGRIHALTAAYALLSREGWSAVPLREVLMEELKPFLASEHINVWLDGPAVMVEPRAALALGIAVHELTTNAAKYGALSVPEGRVTVTWDVDCGTDGDRLALDWIEQDGPPVTRPVRNGFGMTLIERGLAHDLGGEARIEFRPTGVQARLHAPLHGSRAGQLKRSATA
ncbi:CheR family methyltransferase [Rhodopila sp.]|uniref:CheR family methyltransferase n=1 Tax=Rhodopila sp. TaxID=2480087 RepID=UPI003D099AE1